MNELVIWKILTCESYFVLKERQSLPIVRSGLQEIHAALTEEELVLKGPVYNDMERLIDFLSRIYVKFTLRS